VDNSLLSDILIIIGLNFLFAFSHTWLASISVKTAVAKVLPAFMPFYRAAYNILSLIILAVFWYFAPRPHITVYKLEGAVRYMVYFLQFIGLAGFIRALWHIDGSEFIGLKQIVRKMRGTYKPETLDEESSLMIKGPYKYSRHPIYLFSIIIVIAWPAMDLFYFVTAVCFVIYFYIGSVIEEKKLVSLFGETYVKYQQSTGRILPKLKTILRKNE